ncbi:MAG: DNA gyrase inhibitor YacG [Sedimentisphaerales bacterium]|nr:DNA gyrase inhibitor YacG [Sedimentisphaerales bacterium]
MKHRCPICKKPIETSSDGNGSESEFLPFCSERCKLADLGAWLDAEYRIACELQPERLSSESEPAFEGACEEE